ncbi:MAG: ABC transporter substrate-binding protein [Betaproteobacteria bacterium]|nr:MAG: ABC transporter substrate-binding protein [Betaproteobacteria bacterium]
MDRRTFAIGIALGVLADPFDAWAQREGKAHRIGYLNLRAGPDPQDEAFVQALRELGYLEGRNLVIDYRWAAEREEQLPALAAELVALNVEVIVTSATPAVNAAKRATSTIPIVIAAVADPVGSGLVASLGHPGGNVTGMTLLSTELAGKRLQLVHEILPRATRIAVLALGGLSATPLLLAAMRAAAQTMDLELIAQLVTKPEELPGAFGEFQKARAHALFVQVSPLTLDQREAIVGLAAQHRLPAMYEIRPFVDTGGLIAYGPDLVVMYRRAAMYVDKIFKGAKPGDLPIEQPTKFEFVINVKTAKALGLTIPQSLLLRADEVIQ